MFSKVSSAIEILINEGPQTLAKKFKNHFVHNRDLMREVNGPAVDVYDCFIFYKEFEILEIRLNELNDIVDYFVIVEATETFQGDDKDLYFEEKREEFSEFDDKIINYVVEFPNELSSAWEREYYLRDSIVDALKYKTNIQSQDWVIISDADEIPSKDGIKMGLNPGEFNVFSQDLHYYYYNMKRVSPDQPWFGPVMSEYKNFTSGQDFRNKRPGGGFNSNVLSRILLSIKHKQKVNIITNGGKHFSYLGDTDFIIDKIEAYSHTEYNKDKYKNEEIIQGKMEEGRDLFGRDIEFEVVELDNTYPKYLIQNRDKFAHNFK